MPEPAQEVWKAEGRRKALRGNTKLWIWFNQDRKREKKIKNIAKKIAFIHTSSCKPASSTHPSQHHQTASCCLTTKSLIVQSKTQHSTQQKRTRLLRSRYDSWATTISTHLYLKLAAHPAPHRRRKPFMGVQHFLGSFHKPEKQEFPSLPQHASDRACFQGACHPNITTQQDINNSKCHQPSPGVCMCPNRHKVAIESLQSHTHHPWGASGQLGPRWAQASQTVKRKATQQQWNAHSSQRKS